MAGRSNADGKSAGGAKDGDASSHEFMRNDYKKAASETLEKWLRNYLKHINALMTVNDEVREACEEPVELLEEVLGLVGKSAVDVFKKREGSLPGLKAVFLVLQRSMRCANLKEYEGAVESAHATHRAGGMLLRVVELQISAHESMWKACGEGKEKAKVCEEKKEKAEPDGSGGGGMSDNADRRGRDNRKRSRSRSRSRRGGRGRGGRRGRGSSDRGRDDRRQSRSSDRGSSSSSGLTRYVRDEDRDDDECPRGQRRRERAAESAGNAAIMANELRSSR